MLKHNIDDTRRRRALCKYHLTFPSLLVRIESIIFTLYSTGVRRHIAAMHHQFLLGQYLIASSIWACSLEHSSVLALTWAHKPSWQREGYLRVMELLDISSLAFRRWNSRSLNNRNSRMSHTMSTSHLLVHLLYCPIQGGISVLFIRIMHSGTRVISHPDSIVFNRGWVLFKDFICGKNLTVCLLHSAELSQKVPKL